jgi:hypothetical protein
MRTRPYPFISADNSYGTYRGRLYLVYASNSPAGNGNKPDIFCRYSDDQGATWSSAVTVNDEVNSQNYHQIHQSGLTNKQASCLLNGWIHAIHRQAIALIFMHHTPRTVDKHL